MVLVVADSCDGWKVAVVLAVLVVLAAMRLNDLLAKCKEMAKGGVFLRLHVGHGCTEMDTGSKIGTGMGTKTMGTASFAQQRSLNRPLCDLVLSAPVKVCWGRFFCRPRIAPVSLLSIFVLLFFICCPIGNNTWDRYYLRININRKEKGLRWYAGRLRIDEDGDVADQFVHEVKPEQAHVMPNQPKQLPRFQVKSNVRQVKIKDQQMTPDGKFQHLVECQGRLQWV
ncbi:putative ALA-interacting subunit 2 [Bienertia sinuspersici]